MSFTYCSHILCSCWQDFYRQRALHGPSATAKPQHTMHYTRCVENRQVSLSTLCIIHEVLKTERRKEGKKEGLLKVANRHECELYHIITLNPACYALYTLTCYLDITQNDLTTHDKVFIRCC